MSARRGGWSWSHGKQLGFGRVTETWVEVVLGSADTQPLRAAGDALRSQEKSRAGDGRSPTLLPVSVGGPVHGDVSQENQSVSVDSLFLPHI